MAQEPTLLEKFFDALLDQTRQRGGYPGIRSINATALNTYAFIAAYTEVRAAAMKEGAGPAMRKAIDAADVALVALEGASTYATGEAGTAEELVERATWRPDENAASPLLRWQAIRKNAQGAAQAAYFNDEPDAKTCPHAAGTEEAKEWQKAFDAEYERCTKS